MLAASLWGLLPRPVLTRGGLRSASRSSGRSRSGACRRSSGRRRPIGRGTSSTAPLSLWRFSRWGCSWIARRYADVLAGLVALLVSWALVVKVFALDDGRRARLHEPIGYWNTLGLHRGVRSAARASALVAAHGCAASLRLGGRDPADAVARRVAARDGCGCRVARARARPVRAGVSAGDLGAVRLWRSGVFALSFDGIAEGRAVALRPALGRALARARARRGGCGRRRALSADGRRSRGRSLRRAAWVLVPIGVAAFLFFGVRAALDFTDPVTPESPSRFTEGSGNNRAQWWKEAAHGFADNPIVGNGAAAFQVNHRRYRESNVEVREPHSLPLQLLSETGLIGFGLFAGAVVAAALGGAARRARAAASCSRCSGSACSTTSTGTSRPRAASCSRRSARCSRAAGETADARRSGLRASSRSGSRPCTRSRRRGSPTGASTRRTRRSTRATSRSRPTRRSRRAR